MKSKSYIMSVTRKGQVTIPTDLRKKYKIKDKVLVLDEGNHIMIIPIHNLEDLFGIDKEIGIEIAKELQRDKKREVALEEKARF